MRGCRSMINNQQPTTNNKPIQGASMRPRGFATFFAGAMIFAVSTSAMAQEWTRFRGPNGSGISETSFPPHFDEKDFAWKIDLPGTGHSSPVVWGDKVFLTCCNEETATRMA